MDNYNKMMNDYAKQIQRFRDLDHARWQTIEDNVNYKESTQAEQVLKEKLSYIGETFDAIDMDLGNPLYD